MTAETLIIIKSALSHNLVNCFGMQFAIYFSIFFSLTALAGEGPARTTATELYNKYRATNPNSCESIYYGLFSDGKADKATFDGDGINTRVGNPSDSKNNDGGKQKVVGETLSGVKDFYKTFLRSYYGDKLFDTRVIEEWIARLDKTQVAYFGYPDDDEAATSVSRLYPNSAVFMDLGNQHGLGHRSESVSGCTPKSFPIVETELYANTIQGEPIESYRFSEYGPPTIMYGVSRLKTISSRAAAAFTMGHELAHLMDWGNKDLVSCLEKDTSIAARRTIADPFALQFIDMSELIKPIPLTEDLKKILEELDKKEAEENAKKKGGGGDTYNSGRGTSQVNSIAKLLDEGKIEEAQAALNDLEKTGVLPDQMTEHVADAFGTLAVTDFIKKNYPPEKRRAAALAVLFSRPPQLYVGQAADIANKIGSKQTNERRVFRILLANEEFRNFIGCEFATKPDPQSCF